MKSDKVSIIVPVYNVEKYLDECMESILSQTYSNLEVILIDDGSTDSSGNMCDNYKALDNRIVVIHKPNGGLSSARNAGMDIATGDYLIFVDSDDIISLNMVSEMMKKADETGAQIVSSLMTEEREMLDKGQTDKVSVFDSHGALRCIFSDDTILTSASGKMYRSGLWKDIRFPTDKIFEDFATIYKVIKKASKTVAFEDWQYFYRPNPSGITGSPFYHRKMQFFDVAEDVTSGIKDTDPDLVPVIRNRITRQAISYFRDMSSSSYDDKADKKLIIKTIRKGIWKYLFSGYKAKSKMYGLMIAVSPPLARKVFAPKG